MQRVITSFIAEAGRLDRGIADMLSSEVTRFFDSMAEMINIRDRDCRVIYNNQALAEYFGDKVGEFCLMVYEKQEIGCQACPVRAAFEKGAAQKQLRNGIGLGARRAIFEVSVSPVLGDDGSAVLCVETVGDITYRRLAEDALKKSEARLSEAQRIAHLGSWDWNIVTDELYWSDEIYRIFGLPLRKFDATYEAFMERVHREDRKLVNEAVSEAVNKGRPYNIEHRIVLPDGTERVVHEQGEPTFDNKGRAVRMAGTVQDITDRKLAEQENARLMSVAEAANAMKDVGYVFAGVRHELGNPINALKSSLGVLKKELETMSGEDISEQVDIALAALNRMDYLLKSLKSYNMHETQEPQVLDMAGFIDDLVSLTDIDFAERGIDLKVDIKDGALSAFADHRALSQVMLNLLSNAVDALDGIDLPVISISVWREGRFINITLADNGKGMTKEQLELLFRPFITSKRGGTGLGLVIARKLLAGMKGSIDVTSVKYQGTSVHVRIPAGEYR